MLSAGIILFAILYFYSILRPAASAGGEHAEKPVVGLIVTTSEDSWKAEQYRLIIERLSQEDYELVVLQADRSQASQIEQTRALIVYRVNVILLSPLVESAWSHVLEEAAQAKIPVICFDQAIRSGTDLDCHSICFDYEEGAQILIQKLEQKNVLNEEILELVGPVNAYTTRELSRGFRSRLDPLRKSIRYSYCAESLSSYAEEITSGILEHALPIEVILAQNDAMAEGAASAIQKKIASEPSFSRPELIAVGGGETVRTLLENGEIDYVLLADNRVLAEELKRLVKELDLEEPGDAGLGFQHRLLPLTLMEGP